MIFVVILHLFLLLSPRTSSEAEGDSYWLLAMQKELNQFEHNQIIGTKWIFRNKLDESENIIRNKARLVA